MSPYLPLVQRAKLGFLLGSSALFTSVACGERPPPPAATPGGALEIATARAVPEEPAAPIAAHTPGASSFAPSALTAFANQVTDLIGQVLDGKPPPSSPLPLVPWQASDRLVKSRTPSPPPRRADLEFVVFAMELYLVLSADAAAPTNPSPDAGKLETITFLSRTGLKLAKLSVRGPSSPHPIPPWLEGAKQFGAEIFAAARRDALESLLVGGPERPVLGNDLLFSQMMKDLPAREELERAQQLARSVREPIGLRFDDVFVIARDRRGEIWGFKLELEETNGQLAFETSPLIEVSRLEPEQLR